jgi:hypothetical protein
VASLFDVFGRLLLEDKQFQADAVKSGEAAGDAVAKSMGQRLSAGLKKYGTRVLGAGLAAGFGLASKGLLELQNVTADFAAETGASADEADRAGKAINAMAGRNIQPLAEVGAALTKVHTDLGLTGEEAEVVTERFLKFARATRQNAAAAVVAFDDILDQWGLTASDAQGIMDKLIVSHQKYGGEIEQNEGTLAKLAPALRAANFEIDDGIALLGLFGSKGLDADQATAAFAKALTKVKSPEELQALIKDIAATEDPFERASKAADLFGARAGAKLANALGGANLDDYKISIEESTGATERAAEVLDSTFGARFQLLMKGAGAALIGFGSNFGPALTGLASLASLGGAVGGGKLVGGLASVLKKGGARIAAALGVTLGGSLVAGAAEAGGEGIAKMTSKEIERRLAGAATGKVLAAGLEEGLIGAGESSGVKSAAGKLGSKIGGFMGSGIGKGLAALGAFTIVVGAVLQFITTRREIEEQTKALADQTGEFARTATTEALVKAREGVAQDLERLGHDPIGDALGLTARKGIEQTLGTLDSEIQARMYTAAEHTKAGAADIAQALDGASPAAEGLGSSFTTFASKAIRAMGQVVASSKALVSALAADAKALIDGYYEPLITADNLRTTNAQIAAAKRVLADKNASKEAKAEARATLHSLGQTQSEYLLSLAEAGETSSKAYKDGIKSLKKAIREAKGPAKAALQEILDKILEVEAAGKVVPVNVKVSVSAFSPSKARSDRNRAAGGPTAAGGLYVVNENTPKSEFFAPSVPGRILTHSQGMAAMAGAVAGGGDTYQVMLPTSEAPDPFETATQLRRLADFGILTTPARPRRRR